MSDESVFYAQALSIASQVDEKTMNPLMVDTGAAVGSQIILTQIFTPSVDAPLFSVPTGVKMVENSLGGNMLEAMRMNTETVPRSFTPDRQFLLRRKGGTLTFDIQLQGGGDATRAADGDFDLPPAWRLILAANGVIKKSGDGTSTTYGPTDDRTYLTAIVFENGIAYAYGGCLVESISIPFVGGQVSFATVSLRPNWVQAVEVQNFPAFPDLSPPVNSDAGYGNMDLFAPPLLENSGFTYGTTGDQVTRAPSSFTMTLGGTVTPVPDGNVPLSGESLTPADWRATFAGTLMVNSTELTQDPDEMLINDPQTDLQWSLGTATTGPTDAMRFALRDFIMDSYSTEELGSITAHNLTGYASAATNVKETDFILTTT